MKILATTALLLALGTGAANATSTLPPCEFEDSINCVWNAQEQGNGEGASFTNIEGEIHYLLHTVPATDDATLEAQASQAWAIWDAVGASALLPDTNTTVTFAGPYDAATHTLQANEIAVWDHTGAAYLFTFA